MYDINKFESTFDYTRDVEARAAEEFPKIHEAERAVREILNTDFEILHGFWLIENEYFGLANNISSFLKLWTGYADLEKKQWEYKIVKRKRSEINAPES